MNKSKLIFFLYVGEWVIVKSNRRHVFEKSGGTGKDYRTALICVSAGGFIISPLFIYSGKHLMDSWCVGGPNGAHYGITTNVSFVDKTFSSNREKLSQRKND